MRREWERCRSTTAGGGRAYRRTQLLAIGVVAMLLPLIFVVIIFVISFAS
jgi:hypothetical protein